MTSFLSFADAVQNIFNLSANTRRGTLNLRFGTRETRRIRRATHSATDHPPGRALAPPSASSTQCDTRAATFAFTRSTFLGKVHMIFTSTLCRTMLYHTINSSLRMMQLFGLPPPWVLRRWLSLLKCNLLLKYCRPILGALYLNFAKTAVFGILLRNRGCLLRNRGC